MGQVFRKQGGQSILYGKYRVGEAQADLDKCKG